MAAAEVVPPPSMDGSQINQHINVSNTPSKTSACLASAEPKEAVSKHSLFGCSLEMKTNAEKEDVKKIDLKSFDEQEEAMRETRRSRYLPCLPDEATKNLPVSKMLEESQVSVARQRENAEKARNDVANLIKRRKFFEVENPIPRVFPKEVNERYNMPLPSRPLLRNPFKAYNENICQNLGGCDNQYKYTYKRHHGPDWLPREAFMNKSDLKPVVTTVDLPRNIQHMFGTNVCLSVLSDQDKVAKSMGFQRKLLSNRPISTSSRATLSRERDPGYESLGNATRYNIMPGYSYGPFSSYTKNVHSQDVYDRKSEDPQQFKHQKDHVSHWAEANELYNKAKKQWEEYLQTQPELQPNWDRDAKRMPKTQPPAPNETKKKAPKPKTKPITTPEQKPVFEDVVFVTPPLTPFVKPDVARKPSFTRDDEFWDFYDQEASKK